MSQEQEQVAKLIADTIRKTITLPPLHGQVLTSPIMRKRRHRQSPTTKTKFAAGALFVTLTDGFLKLPIVTDPKRKKGGGGDDGGDDGSGGGVGNWNGPPQGSGGGGGGSGGGGDGISINIKPPPPPDPTCKYFLVYKFSIQTIVTERRRGGKIGGKFVKNTYERTTDVLPYTSNCLTHGLRNGNITQINRCSDVTGRGFSGFSENNDALVRNAKTNQIIYGNTQRLNSLENKTITRTPMGNISSYDIVTVTKSEYYHTEYADGGETIPTIKANLISQSGFYSNQPQPNGTASYVDNLFDLKLAEAFTYCPNAGTLTPFPVT